MEEVYYTTEEVAERLKVSQVTIQALCRSGQLPAARVGRQWRIKQSDLDLYLAAAKEVPLSTKKSEGLIALTTRPTIAGVTM